MIKWFKLTRTQYFGFWWIGVLLFVIQELPYMVMPFIDLSTNPIMNMQESSSMLDLLEKLLGSGCIAALLLVNHRGATLFSVVTKREKLFFGLSIFVLLLNFVGWFLYDNGFQPLWVMMFFLVMMPPLYYLFIGLWRRNKFLVALTIPFLFVHFIHVLNNLT